MFYIKLPVHKHVTELAIYSLPSFPRGSVSAFASVRTCNSKTIAPIDLIFVHKKAHSSGPVLL